MQRPARQYEPTPCRHLRGDQLADTFKQIDSLLLQYESLWRLQPMHCLTGISAENPVAALASILHHAMPADSVLVTPLLDAVSALSLQQIEEIDASVSAQREFFAPLLPPVVAMSWLTEPPSNDVECTFPFWLTNGIGGRKLSQIKALIAHTPTLTGTLVEWCAGKGHLGRLLSFANNGEQSVKHLTADIVSPDSLDIISLEWQAKLCAIGTQMAEQLSIPQTFQQTDVLSGAGQQTLMVSEHAVALHACGDLHRKLLEQGAKTKLQSLWVVPCCYHLTAQTTYRALSSRAQASSFSLSREELKLAVQGQVTAGARTSQLRRTEVTWRLAYQVVCEQYAHANEYTPLPSVPKHWFSGQFEDFAAWASEHHDWVIPDNVNWPRALHSAEQRYLLLKQVDLIRHAFRRPLELWLALDRALFLQEAGYDVTLQAFCEYQMTPRNLLISASHQ